MFTELIIDQNKLVKNYHDLANINPHIKIAPVIKSNAYGHDINIVAKTLDPLSPPFFCVDNSVEAKIVEKLGIKTPVLIMGQFDSHNINSRWIYAVKNLSEIEILGKSNKLIKIHLFVDTGMNREGLLLTEINAALQLVSEYHNLIIDGVMSHYACSEIQNHPLNVQQQQTFSALNIASSWKHLGNSFGLVNFPLFKNANAARIGLKLYDSVLTIKSQLRQIKQISAGEFVGYDCRFQAKSDMTLGIIPAGYYHGIDRRLSNKGFVLIGKTRCPIVGLVNMNILTIDISKINNPFLGQEVIFSLEQMARDCNCDVREIMAGISPEIPRITV